MKKLMEIKYVVSLLFLVAITTHAEANSIAVMALGSLDQRAVVQLSDARMQVLKPGDTVEGTQFVVQQILNDRLVVEDTIKTAGDKSAKQTVWIYKAVNGQSRVMRLDKEKPVVNIEQQNVISTPLKQ